MMLFSQGFGVETVPLFANIFRYFAQSNAAGQVIIFVLVLFSLLAWTVMIGKYIDLSRARRANLGFEKRISATQSLLRVDPGLNNTSGIYAELTREALKSYHRARGSAYAVDHVENALQRAVSIGSMRYESKMVLLGSIVSGAPFLGLLGTVWGVMDAFGSISGSGGASVATLAPGVSGALLTTVAGLLVAIPSVFGYNYLLAQVKLMINELETYASRLADRVELEAKEE